MDIIAKDAVRYGDAKMPAFQKYYRKSQQTCFKPVALFYRWRFARCKKKNHIELYYQTSIGEGLYFGHPYNITINAKTVIGKNCNLHKGVTLGQENRGPRKGTPTLGDRVWVGVNATIVGNITVGDDVLIAPNTFVNCDVPSHSVVFGNPCIIKPKENATAGYVSRTV